MSELEGEEELRQLKQDAYEFLGDEDDENYKIKFARLKQKLFHPEIEEMIVQYEAKFKELSNDLVATVSKIVRSVESRAKEMEECATELSEGMMQRVDSVVRDLKWSKSEVKMDDPYSVIKRRPTSSVTSLKKINSVKSI